jgi:polyhydroxyalkanoate synthesis regulator phasin
LVMASDPRFKKVQDAGADFLETARVRAEEFLRELSKAGDTTQERAQGAVDDFMGGSRRGTEQLIGSIRREISAQLGLLGLATKADLSDLEARLNQRMQATGGAKEAGSVKKAAPKKSAAKATAAAKAAPAKSASPKKSAAPAKKAPAKKAAG